MKIRNISCTQFAGVRDRDASFTDGINVIYGKNESGKSTLVNLISRTLFQNARLDRRSDKDFYELYFPGARKGNAVLGDFADGRITFETKNGTYTLSKEWGADPRCTLSTPDGVIRDQETINEILGEALLYGEGVYSEMLFSSQRNTDISLQTLLDASKKSDAKQEIADAVSMAFAESDGVSVDAVGQAIADKISELAGKHWDFEREAPMRKAGRWSTGLGEVLKAYYALEDARAVLDNISRLEADADRAASDYAEKDAAVRIAEEAYNKFNTFAGSLALQSERKKTAARVESELLRISEVLRSWPVIAESLEKAKALLDEKANRELVDKYEAAAKTMEELESLELESVGLSCPTEDEILQVYTAQRTVAALENKLCGMNITAVLKMLNGNSVQVTSLRTGESIDVNGGTASLTEAVRITVPGVMELQLAPADVDMDSIEAQISEQKKKASDILTRYGAASAEELEASRKRFTDVKGKADGIRARLDMLLGDTTYEELVTAFNGIAVPVRTGAEIDKDIADVCQSTDAARFVTAKETVIEGYITEYGSIDGLKARAFDLREELEGAKTSLACVQNVPAEFADIPDPERHLEDLQNDLKLGRELRELALTAKTAAASKLETYSSDVSEDPAADVLKAEREFEEQRSLLSHWCHIEEVFKAQKESLRDNPMQDIANSFTHYLDVISGGRVSSEFPEADRLNMNIYSDNRLLDYAKLSEGTKDTVSLAFRLAVLDHLFPDGGGVIVLDDPFTDMDAERTAVACELIKDCAKRHQVIFLTCREDYLEML